MISKRKIDSEKYRIRANCNSCKGSGCAQCNGYCSYVDRMAEAEIPVDYWFRDINDFYGNPDFCKAVKNYINNIDESYRQGICLCFTGHPGTGKTMAACSILKKALLPSVDYYSAFYVTLVDLVSYLHSSHSHYYRDAIKKYDFLVIDEVDQRFFPSENSRELYGNHFENVLRTRAQNHLPTIICTNSEDVDQIFAGEFQRTFKSLKSQFIKVLRSGGKDARKGQERL